MARRDTKWAKMVMDAWLCGLDAPTLTPSDKECVEKAIAGLKLALMNHGDSATIAAFDMCNLILANLISRQADFEVLRNPTKENLEMAVKANERILKTKNAVGPNARGAVRERGGGIGSRLRPLILRAHGAVERSIVDLDRQEPPSDVANSES